MPGITARICGICPVSHHARLGQGRRRHLAVNIPARRDKLRRLMNLGQIIQSHALSFFHLRAPDFLLGCDSDPGQAQRLRPDRREPGARPRAASGCASSARRSSRCSAARRSTRPGPCPAASRAADRGRPRPHPGLAARGAGDDRSTLDLLQARDGPPPATRRAVFGNFPSLFMGLVTPDGTWEHYDGKLRFIDAAGRSSPTSSTRRSTRSTSAKRSRPGPTSSPRTTSRSAIPAACIASARWRGSTSASAWARRRPTASWPSSASSAAAPCSPRSTTTTRG